MNNYFTRAGVWIVLFFSIPFLCLIIYIISSFIIFPNYKSNTEQPYGSFLIEQVNVKARRLFGAPDHIRSYYNLYYDGEEIDIESLANKFIPDKNFRDVMAIDVRPLLTKKSEALYILLRSEKIGYGDSVLNTALYALKREKRDFSLIHLLDLHGPSGWSGLYKMDSVYGSRVMYKNYLIDEETLRVEIELAELKECRYEEDYSKGYNSVDSTLICNYGETYYGVSPDKKWIVRSMDALEMSSLKQLYISEISGNTTKVFPIAAIDRLMESPSGYQYSPDVWFQRNFEWKKEGDGYVLALKH